MGRGLVFTCHKLRIVESYKNAGREKDTLKGSNGNSGTVILKVLDQPGYCQLSDFPQECVGEVRHGFLVSW